MFGVHSVGNIGVNFFFSFCLEIVKRRVRCAIDTL
jgi:hypothetical protein